MNTRTPLRRRLGDERFGPATSQMLKRVPADSIEFREIYFSMDPRFRERENEERIEQVRQDILSPEGPTRWESATIFYLAKSMYLKQSLQIKRSLTAHAGKTLNTALKIPPGTMLADGNSPE